MAEKKLTWSGFRTMAAWFINVLDNLYTTIKADYDADIKADYDANIKKQIVCSVNEYIDMLNAGTLQEDMLYFVFKEDKEA